MRFFLLDPLRGIAAFWVLTFHWGFSESFQQAFPFLHSVFKEGHLGVPLFFVISGYCITAAAHSSVQRNKSVGYFLKRRLFRIYPTFWFSIALVLSLPYLVELMSMLKTGSYLWPDLSTKAYLQFQILDWFSHASLVQVFSLSNFDASPGISIGHDLAGKFAPLMPVYWSLAIELQFYFVVAVLLILPISLNTGLLIVSLVSIPFAFSAEMYAHGIFLPYWPMFALGCALFVALERGFLSASIFGARAWKIGVSFFVVGLIMFLTAVWSEFRINNFLLASFFTCFLWFAWDYNASVSAFISGAKGGRKVIVSLFLALGAMSYSLYLIHFRLTILSEQFARQLFVAGSISYDIVVLLLTCVLCYPFYLLFEKPFIGFSLTKFLGWFPKRVASNE